MQIARELGLDHCLRLGTSELNSGGRDRASSLEDACEALFGALYLDSDWSTARRVMLHVFGDLNARLQAVGELRSPKSRLQELAQPVHGNHAVRYAVTSTEGPDHDRRYFVEVYLLDRPLGQGSGTSKQAAEEAAARAALESLGGKLPG